LNGLPLVEPIIISAPPDRTARGPARRLHAPRDPFWISAKVLLEYKRQIAILLLASTLAAVCWGAGIAMVLPMFTIFLDSRQNLPDFLLQRLVDAPGRSDWLRALGHYAAAHVPQGRYAGFLTVMGVIAVLTFIGCIARYVHELMSITVASRATQVWRNRCFRHLIRVPLVKLGQTGSTDYISRISNDTRVVEFGYQTIVGKPLHETFKAVAALTCAMFINWKLAIFAVVSAPLLLGLLRWFGKRILRAAKAALGHRGRMLSALHESLGALSVVKVHDAEGYERRRFSRINQDLFAEEMKMRQAKAISSPLVEYLTVIGVLVLASVAAYFVLQKQVDPAEFIAVLSLLAGASGCVRPLSQVGTQLYESSSAAARVLEIFDLPVEPVGLDDRRHAADLPRHRRDIAFEQVTFSYPGQDRAAVGAVSLHVPFGHSVAIVGSNGSGKTTLLHLLSRLLDPEQGRVLIDGVDIATVNLRSLRSQIAVVTQQSVLFEDTIAGNITYGRRYESLDRVVAAARAAFADEFISALPRGYQTPLGEDGSGLSGGQRQRICIARAILRDPAILILDEATSQIDADSEAKINQALRTFRHGRTTFVIAHRLSTVVDADLIVVMDDGRIVAQGTHAQLLETCDIYRTLNLTQLQPRAT
jgi:ABC-type multidrug transport system fused ATPase/permease subunit